MAKYPDKEKRNNIIRLEYAKLKAKGVTFYEAIYELSQRMWGLVEEDKHYLSESTITAIISRHKLNTIRSKKGGSRYRNIDYWETINQI